MTWRVRYAPSAREELLRLYEFLLEHDLDAAEQALDAIEKGVDVLRSFPFTPRKVQSDAPFLRELLVSFGASGYVALYEIEEDHTVTILALRHQREDDYR